MTCSSPTGGNDLKCSLALAAVRLSLSTTATAWASCGGCTRSGSMSLARYRRRETSLSSGQVYSRKGRRAGIRHPPPHPRRWPRRGCRGAPADGAPRQRQRGGEARIGLPPLAHGSGGDSEEGGDLLLGPGLHRGSFGVHGGLLAASGQDAARQFRGVRTRKEVAAGAPPGTARGHGKSMGKGHRRCLCPSALDRRIRAVAGKTRLGEGPVGPRDLRLCQGGDRGFESRRPLHCITPVPGSLGP